MTRIPLRSAVLAAALILVFAVTAFAQSTIRGTWTAEYNDKEPAHLQMRFNREGRDMNMSNTMDFAAFRGLDLATVQAANRAAKFQLVRDAGTLQFDGAFNNGLGHGEFTFTPSAEYVSGMKQMGFNAVGDKLFELAILDVSRAYAKELRDLGYKPDLEELISARIFNVNREQVAGLKAVGVTDLPLKKLIEYRIFKVTPDYVREMRAAFPNISTDKMVEMRIHKATPEFAREMAQLGYSRLDADQLVAFRIHNVTPEFIREVRQLGFKDLSPDDLVQFRIFGVNAQQVQELAREGVTGLSPEQLVAFRIHHVDADFVRKVKKAGYPHPSPDQLVEFKIMGIRVHETDL